MDILDIQRAKFNDLWSLMQVDEHRWPNRYAATFTIWRTRSRAAQEGMLEKAEGGIGTKNPFFFVQDFPDPQPVFLKGNEDGDLVQVKYNGLFKICTRATMEFFGLEYVRDWN
jgi:hypothetical protein